jgi:DNA topoisomerase I
VTEDVPKPPRASLPKGWSASDIDLEKALTLLSLPRQIGPHPEDGEMVEAGIGRYGPFVKHGRIYANLKEVDDVFTIGMNRAVEEIARKLASRGGAGREQVKPLHELGEHPTDGGSVNVYDGRYGPYVKFGKINATLPKDVTPESVTMDVAVALITEKAAKKGGGKVKAKAKAKAKPKGSQDFWQIEITLHGSAASICSTN